MTPQELTCEIFDICGPAPDHLHLLVSVQEDPGDFETYRTAVVRIEHGQLTADVMWDDWAKTFWQSPNGTIYVAGAKGAIYSKRSGPWSMVQLDPQYIFEDTWGLNDDHVYCCGMDDVLVTTSGSGWVPFNDGLSGDLKVIRGSALDDLYVLGTRGAVFRYEGTRWVQLPSPTNNRLMSVLPLTRGQAYFCGHNGVFFRFANGSWENFSLQKDAVDLYRLAIYRNRIFVCATQDGIFEFDGHSLVHLAPQIAAGTMHVIGDVLYGVGGNLLHAYDGTKWTTTELDFSKVISI